MNDSSRQRQRLRLRCFADRVSPGEKSLPFAYEELDEKGHEQLAMEPGLGCLLIRFSQVAEPDYRFESLEYKFYLPSAAVHFQHVARSEQFRGQGGKDEDESCRLKGLGLGTETAFCA